MNLKILTDECLLSETKALVQRERELLTNILHHLREIERRRLYQGHTSLYNYVTAVLRYSEDAAYRRISAMRLLRELPDLEVHIEAGHLNLSHVGLAQSLFNREKKLGQPLSPDTKLEVLAEMAGRSTREAERVAQKYSSEEPKTRESVRAIADDRNILTLEVTDDVLKDLEKLRGLLAHEDPNMSLGSLIGRMAKLALEQWNPAKPPCRKTSPHSKAAVRRAIWLRDNNACVRCKSHFAVEEDHVVPVSMGGEYSFENVRLLCRSCNQRAAIEKLGLDKMNPYLSPDFPH